MAEIKGAWVATNTVSCSIQFNYIYDYDQNILAFDFEVILYETSTKSILQKVSKVKRFSVVQPWVTLLYKVGNS